MPEIAMTAPILAINFMLIPPRLYYSYNTAEWPASINLRWRSGALSTRACGSTALETDGVADRIAIASDHAAVDLKAALAEHLRAGGHEVLDLGPAGADPVDYPDYGYRLAEAVASGEADKGVAICGSGIGISIAVNRHPGARAALISEPLSARLAREHNDANVIAMGARLIGITMAKACLDAFLGATYEGERHRRRVEKLSNPSFAKEPA
jgi:ribose 5-phosphate isomerase B